MPDDIPPIPAIPPALREAAQLTKLIPFVWAGASKLAGCPDWNEFADAALKVFVDCGKFSYAQVDQIKSLRLADLGFRPVAIDFCDRMRSMPGLADLFRALAASS